MSAQATRRGVARRSILTMADQSVCSASNFAITVVVAHLVGLRGLGVFSVGYAAWLFVASLHRSLVTDPMAIEGDAQSPEAHERIVRGLAAELVFGVSAAAVTLLAGAGLVLAGWSGAGEGLLAVGIWLPFLAIQDFWRWVGFLAGRPDRSLANDIIVAVVQLGLLGTVLVRGIDTSVGWLFACWGAGALLGAAYGCWQFRAVSVGRGGAGLLAERWRVSRWLVGNDLTLWGSSQGYLLLAGIILGSVELGGLKAVQALVTGPAFVLLQVAGSIGLPEGAMALERGGPRELRRVARRLSLLCCLAIAVMAGVVAVFGPWLLATVYGAGFAQLHLTAAVLAAAYAVAGLGLGPTVTLKTTRRTARLFRDQLLGLVVTLVASAVLAELRGVEGVAIGVLVGACFQAALLTTSARAGRPAPSHRTQPQRTLARSKPRRSNESKGLTSLIPGSRQAARSYSQGVALTGAPRHDRLEAAPRG